MSGSVTGGAAQDAWVASALGFTIPGHAAAADPVPLRAAITDYRDANDTVDAQIGQLQAALRREDDAELQEIGEYGLNAITGGYKAKLMAAMMGAERGTPGDIAKLAALVPQYRAHLESDERVEACDDNPFGVAVGIRAALLPALEGLARSLPR